MALKADQMLDKLLLKQQLGRWKLLTFVMAAFVILLAFGRFGSMVSESPISPYVARLKVEGVIVENDDLYEAIETLQKDPRVKAVEIYINSPGGTMVGGELLHDHIKRLNQVKPVVARMGSVAASGGYMAAVAAEYIVAQRGTMTGSIGVMMQLPEVTGLADKLGISILSIKSSPLKGQPSPFEKLNPVAKEAIQATIDDSYQLFVSMVMEGRDLSKKEALLLADGRIYTGRQAHSYKLVDALGGREQVKSYLREKHQIDESLPYKDVKVGKAENIFQEFTSRIFPSMPVKAGLMAILPGYVNG